jgi:hypothetical protein
MSARAAAGSLDGESTSPGEVGAVARVIRARQRGGLRGIPKVLGHSRNLREVFHKPGNAVYCHLNEILIISLFLI